MLREMFEAVREKLRRRFCRHERPSYEETDEARARRYMSAMERMYQMVESMDVSGSVVNELLRDGVGEIFWNNK